MELVKSGSTLKKVTCTLKKSGYTIKKVRGNHKKIDFESKNPKWISKHPQEVIFAGRVRGGINTCRCPFGKFSFSSLAEKNEKNFVLLFIYVINTIYTLLKTEKTARTPLILLPSNRLWMFGYQLKEFKVLKNE